MRLHPTQLAHTRKPGTVSDMGPSRWPRCSLAHAHPATLANPSVIDTRGAQAKMKA